MFYAVHWNAPRVFDTASAAVDYLRGRVNGCSSSMSGEVFSQSGNLLHRVSPQGTVSSVCGDDCPPECSQFAHCCESFYVERVHCGRRIPDGWTLGVMRKGELVLRAYRYQPPANN